MKIGSLIVWVLLGGTGWPSTLAVRSEKRAAKPRATPSAKAVAAPGSTIAPAPAPEPVGLPDSSEGVPAVAGLPPANEAETPLTGRRGPRGVTNHQTGGISK